MLAIPPEADQPQAEVSATRNLGNKKLLDARFRGHDGGEPSWIINSHCVFNRKSKIENLKLFDPEFSLDFEQDRQVRYFIERNVAVYSIIFLGLVDQNT